MVYKTSYAAVDAVQTSGKDFIASDSSDGFTCTLNGQSFWIPKKAFLKMFEPKKESTFCRKDSEVKAIQYTEHMNMADLESFLSPFSYLVSSEPTSEGDLIIYGEGVSIYASLYDWIVKDYLGHIRIISPIVFSEMYKQI